MNKQEGFVSTSRGLILIGLVVLSLAVGRVYHATSQSNLPQKIAGLSDLVQLTPAEVERLKAGQIVTKPLESDSDHEVAVLGVVWVNAPVNSAVQALKDIEHLEHGEGFQVTKRISDPPRLEDFNALDVPEQDLRDLQKCTPGKCEVKLDEQAISRIQKGIDWSKPTATADVNALLRQLALEYVTAYQKGGNEELAVYRDHSRPAYIAKEFAALINGMPVLQKGEPELRRYLLEYPNAQLPNATSFLYWQKVNFGLKPVVRINHVVITENEERAVVASKLIYASHYFWTALEVRELIPDPSRGKGFWLIDVSKGRSRSLTGFKGHMISGRVHDEAVKGMTKGMQTMKSSFERTSG